MVLFLVKLKLKWAVCLLTKFLMIVRVNFVNSMRFIILLIWPLVKIRAVSDEKRGEEKEGSEEGKGRVICSGLRGEKHL